VTSPLQQEDTTSRTSSGNQTLSNMHQPSPKILREVTKQHGLLPLMRHMQTKCEGYVMTLCDTTKVIPCMQPMVLEGEPTSLSKNNPVYETT
jgi:hypothetical protein